MATILRVYNDLGQKYDLDIFNEQQFLLDISAIESGDIGKVFGISSQTFSLPATPNNNEYFGNLFDLGATYPSSSLIDNSSTPTSFIKTFPCQVLTDGIQIFDGRLYLESIITDNDGDTIYNVNVVNEIVDFKYLIKDVTFGDLDWSAYQHDYTLANITSSWDLNLFGGDVVYPLAEYGFDANSATSTEIQNGGQPKTFTNYSSPLLVNDFKPAIRITSILDNIFDSVDYKYTSSFFESSYADTIYMLATKDSTRGTSFVSPISQSFKAYATASQDISQSFIATPVSFSAELYDTAGNFNTTNYRFTATETGQYSFDFYAIANVQNYGYTPIRLVYVDLYINGAASNVPSVIYDITGLGSSGVAVPLSANFSNINLNASDYVQVFVTFETDNGSEELRLSGGASNCYFQCYQSPDTIVGGLVDLKGVFNVEESVLDFLNGLIQKFNLVIEPDASNPKVLSIEPFNTWVDNGSQVDWTDKVDRSVKWEIRHPMANQPRKLKFTDVEDKDMFNQYSVTTFNKIFGSTIYTSESDLDDGEKTIGTYFAPTPMKYIEGSTDFIVPQIFIADNGAKKRFTFKPRLLHYLGKANSYLQGKNASNATIFNTWYVKDENENVVGFNQHPVFHHLSKLPATQDGTTKDLHFNNPQHWEYHMPQVDARTYNDAVYEYWSFYINELYDVDGRLLTLNVDLKPSDIPKIRLNDKIFIDGHYYRINKISGANLTNEQSTKVELIKSLPRKLRFPRRRIPIDNPIEIGVGYEDVFVGEVNVTGGVVYNDWNTGDVVTDDVVIEKAGFKDGFNVYSGSVNWTPIPASKPTSNVINGVNYVDERATNVNIQGSGNVIQSGISNVTILGDSNTISQGTQNLNLFGNNVSTTGSVESSFIINTTTSSVSIDAVSNIVAINPTEPITTASFYEGGSGVVVGNLRTQGVPYYTYDIITGSSGDSMYITGSHLNHYLHQYSWSGSSGTYAVYLEDATLVDGVVLKFKVDNSFTGTMNINLIPSSSQLIDGNPEYPLDNAWQSATIMSIGSNWTILEASNV